MKHISQKEFYDVINQLGDVSDKLRHKTELDCVNLISEIENVITILENNRKTKPHTSVGEYWVKPSMKHIHEKGYDYILSELENAIVDLSSGTDISRVHCYVSNARLTLIANKTTKPRKVTPKFVNEERW